MTVFNISCPICLELIVEPVTLPCGHNLCKYCEENIPYDNAKKLCCVCRSYYHVEPKMNIDLHNILMNVNKDEYTKRLVNIGHQRMMNVWGTKYFNERRFKMLLKRIIHLVDLNQKIEYENLVKKMVGFNEKEIIIALKHLDERDDIIIMDDDIISVINLDRYLKDLLAVNKLSVDKALFLLIKGYTDEEDDLRFLYNICNQKFGPTLSLYLADEYYYSNILYPFLKEFAEKNGYDENMSGYFPNNPMNGDFRINRECIVINNRGNNIVTIPKLNLNHIYNANVISDVTRNVNDN